MKRRNKISDLFKSLFTFTRGEARGVIILLPLLALISFVLVFAQRPSVENSFLAAADLNDQQIQNVPWQDHPSAVKDDGHYHPNRVQREMDGSGIQSGSYNENHGKVNGDDFPGISGSAAINTLSGISKPQLFTFDPNTVTLQELCRLGFNTRTAAGIIKYREKGKRFEIPEDFATCYGVTIEQYTMLEPYIIIGERHAVRKSTGDISSDGMNQNNPVMGNDGVDRIGNDTRGEGFATDPATHPYRRPLVNLNTADSAALRAVSGIGEATVMRIITYRERLGGFNSPSQLAEIAGMTEANYERILPQIFVDSCEIQKIDINFASHKMVAARLGNHPYCGSKTTRKLLSQRQLKGGWSTIGDMVEQHILTPRQAELLAPYLLFLPLEN